MSFQRIFWWVHLFLALLFATYYLAHTVVMKQADPHLLAHFAGYRPYQLRVLMPLLLAVGEQLGLDIVRGSQLMTIGSVLALAVAFWAYLREFLSETGACYGALLMWPVLSFFYSHHWFYLYDLPAVLFLTLGLLFLQRQQWALLDIVILVATLNRESSILLVMAYAANCFAPRTRLFWMRLGGYSALWLTAKIGLAVVFAHNPGQNVEWQVRHNLWFLTHPQDWSPGFWLSFLLLGLLSGLAVVMWKGLPRLTRVGVILSAGLLGVLLFVGVIDETRLFGETVPLLLAPVLIGIGRIQKK